MGSVINSGTLYDPSGEDGGYTSTFNINFNCKKGDLLIIEISFSFSVGLTGGPWLYNANNFSSLNIYSNSGFHALGYIVQQDENILPKLSIDTMGEGSSNFKWKVTQFRADAGKEYIQVNSEQYFYDKYEYNAGINISTLPMTFTEPNLPDNSSKHLVYMAFETDTVSETFEPYGNTTFTFTDDLEVSESVIATDYISLLQQRSYYYFIDANEIDISIFKIQGFSSVNYMGEINSYNNILVFEEYGSGQMLSISLSDTENISETVLKKILKLLTILNHVSITDNIKSNKLIARFITNTISIYDFIKSNKLIKLFISHLVSVEDSINCGRLFKILISNSIRVYDYLKIKITKVISSVIPNLVKIINVTKITFAKVDNEPTPRIIKIKNTNTINLDKGETDE